MPRLLLVDDNPSIHRIAESLLAPTDVELVCVDSAAEALDRIGHGERFDVLLVDTAMPGMDGWTLLARLREMEATARLPIALMAGVLDPVDPAKLAKAPVQGFLKKPIELRELGDRVKALLATPVPPAVAEPSAFTTVPATPARDLVRMAEASLPEFREDYPAREAAEPAPVESPSVAGLEDDLLVLTAEDLWPEEAEPASAAPVPAPVPAEVRLELEELDLDSLQDLATDPLPSISLDEAAPAALESVETYELPALEADELPALEPPVPEIPEAAAEGFDGPVAEALAEESLLSFTDLEALEGLPMEAELPPPPSPAPGAFEAPWAGTAVAAPVAQAIPEALHAVPGQSPAAPGQVPLTAEQIQTLLADPVLMEALTKAVVARMGDQVIREIAWEVMPDLAGRLQR